MLRWFQSFKVSKVSDAFETLNVET
jgi:hypothetical protein